MSEKDTTSNTKGTSGKIDLNSLTDLSFGPSWADKSSAQKRGSPKDSFAKSSNYPNSKSHGFKRDRRSQLSPNRQSRNTGDSKGAFSGRRERRDDFKRKPMEEFKPSFEVKIYPQDDAFDFLVKRLRSNFKTYQLFEITRLILEKADRFVAAIEPIKSDSGDKKLIYFSTKDGIPFSDEESALDHFLENNLEDYFDIEAVEVGAPTGNFNLIYRCPFTGTLISPPNFHRFQELLKLHHRRKIKNLSLSDYQNKLESVNDEAAINEWIEAMKKGERLTFKNTPESEAAIVFHSKDDAKRYLLMNKKADMVKSTESFRLSGSLLGTLPKGLIKENVMFAVEGQRRFPLDTANNIRGRLRRHKFTIYKKGSKGISFVCCVKRKFRDSKSVFSESIINLINFIEKNENIMITTLPYDFLSIEKPKVKKPSKSESSNADKPASTEAVTAPSQELSEEDQAKFKQFMRDLRWLITEGYVTEYSDGTVFVHPKMDESQKPTKDSPKASEEPQPKPQPESEDPVKKVVEEVAEAAVESQVIGESTNVAQSDSPEKEGTVNLDESEAPVSEDSVSSSDLISEDSSVSEDLNKD